MNSSRPNAWPWTRRGGNGLGDGRRPEPPCRFPAVQHRQTHIHENEIRGFGLGELHALLAIKGDDHLVAPPLQVPRQHVAVRLVIPTVCLGVTSAMAYTYGYGDGRIGPTRCALIDGRIKLTVSPLLAPIASHNLLFLQSLPASILYRQGNVRRRKDDTCVGTAARRNSSIRKVRGAMCYQ